MGAGETAQRRKTGQAHAGLVACARPPDCEARFALLEKTAQELSETVFSGVPNLSTRVALTEESVLQIKENVKEIGKKIDESLGSISAKLDERGRNWTQIVVAVITAVSAIVCSGMGLLVLLNR